ncbi:prostatic acid phosphatase isoform X1 [Parasteatoda tepidariorum]|uniref:prostatic acid phosphatase isoform X1 n=1 Tax=Parasteatoda tepidariorum TaxID=114398 RepID=UPI00077FD24F|nr:prostatic acid phosphatase isoform X1 [Parasteatoda tepidariorum]
MMRRIKRKLFFLFMLLIFLISIRNVLDSIFADTPYLFKPFNLEPFMLFTNEKKRELVLLQMIVRHGHRAPYVSWPTNIYNAQGFWKEGYQSLTQLGRLQNYVMGKHLQNFYKNFITTNPKEVNVLATEAARALYGAYAFMAGLYAPKKENQFSDEIQWQPIIPYTAGYKDIFGRNSKCKRANDELDAFHNSKLYNETLERHKFLYRFLTFHTRVVVEGPFEASDIARTLNTQEYFNLSSPKWSEPCRDELEYQILLNYYFLYSTKILLRYRVGNLLNHMVNNMILKMNDDMENKRVIVYAGHGSTITQVLLTLNKFSFVETPMGSVLVLELWKEDDTYSLRFLHFNSSSPEIRINPPVSLHFEECGGSFCSVESFLNKTAQFRPDDFKAECDYKMNISLRSLDTVCDLPLFVSSSEMLKTSHLLLEIINIFIVISYIHPIIKL